MKTVPCSYEKCGDRRPNWGSPEETRPHQTIEVADDHEGPMFCSITCAIMAGYKPMFIMKKVDS